MKDKDIPWGPIGYITYKRTYAREIKDGVKEEFTQTIDRVIKSCDKQLNVGFTKEEEEKLRGYLLKLKGSVAGRFLWQMGTKTVDRLGLLSLQNCAACIVNEPISPFIWAMDALMLGSGVGFNIQREYVYEIPKVKRKKIKVVRKDTKDADFIVPDNREGWIELVKRTLEAHFITGEGFSYSTICVRGKGTPIKSFGGIAAGPEDLCWGVAEISKVLNNRSGKKVRPIDCLDIMNIIGAIVVSGNVRRSAQICIGDSDDLQYLNAKRWDKGNIPNWRAMSNNSVVCNNFEDLPEQFWEGYKGNGEPYGLINLKLSKEIGRLGETQYPDPDVVCYNPCQPEFATVLTEKGIKQFKDIEVGSKIWSNEGWTTVVNKWSTGIKPVYKYKTSGGTFIGTENHRLVSRDGKVEAKDCENVHVIGGPLVDTTQGYDDNFITDGMLLTDTIDDLTPSQYQSLLRGYYSVNGIIENQTDGSVKIKCSTRSETIAEGIQIVLSSLGIRSHITFNSSKGMSTVSITKDFREFYSRVGFIQDDYMNRIARAIETSVVNNSETFSSMKEVEFVGEHEVFDITVDNSTHTYWTGGLNVSNCAEQSLANKETCSLGEIHLPNIESEEELVDVAKMLYRINKHGLTLPCHQKETEAIVHKNMRMGLGITGFAMATDEQKSWLNPTYSKLREFDIEYSKKNNLPTSIKITTVKPSGTLSLLSGVTPGAHPGFSHFFIRRMRMASNTPLVELCRKNGFHVEYAKKFDGTEDHNTVVVEFPCSFPKHSVVARDVTAIDQLETIKFLQKNWSDNAVSVTIYYRKEELDEIKKWLSENYNDGLKTVSFLLHSDHGFVQAPYEEITEEKYNELVAKTTPITNCEVDESSISSEEIGCEGGACPIK